MYLYVNNLRGRKDKSFICDDAEDQRSQHTTYIDPSVKEGEGTDGAIRDLVGDPEAK